MEEYLKSLPKFIPNALETIGAMNDLKQDKLLLR